MTKHEPNKGIAETINVELDTGYSVKIVSFVKPSAYTRDDAISEYIKYMLDDDPQNYRWRIVE